MNEGVGELSVSKTLFYGGNVSYARKWDSR